MKRVALFAFVSVVLLVTLSPGVASAQYQSNSLTVKVYADGSAHVTQVLSANSSDVSIKVALLTSILTDAVVVDQNGSPLSFQISGSNMTIYTLGSADVTLQYDTDALTNKQGTVWTLNLTTAYDATAILPQSSTVISVSPTPNSFSTQDGSPVVTVFPGAWQVSYGVSVSIGGLTTSSTAASSSSASVTSAQSSSSSAQSSPSSSTSVSSTGSSTGHPTVGGTLPYAYIVAVALVAAAASVGVILLRRRNSSVGLKSTDLRPDDVQVLNFITEQGGKVFEPEIRTRFMMPKTSAWRQVKRLERLGYVRINKVGSQNQIEILKNRERTAS